MMKKAYLKCQEKDCGFIVFLLAQMDKEVTVCPVCGESNLDYMSYDEIIDYLDEVMAEITAIKELH